MCAATVSEKHCLPATKTTYDLLFGCHMLLLFKHPTCLCHQVGPATPDCSNLFMWETLSINLLGLSKKDVSAYQLPVFVAAPHIQVSFIYNRERSKICLKGYRSNTTRFRLCLSSVMLRKEHFIQFAFSLYAFSYHFFTIVTGISEILARALKTQPIFWDSLKQQELSC